MFRCIKFIFLPPDSQKAELETRAIFRYLRTGPQEVKARDGGEKLSQERVNIKWHYGLADFCG